MEAVRASAADPADGIRMLVQIITALSAAMPQPQAAPAAMVRRFALSSLARACAAYNPSSSTEASALRAQVVALFDADVLAAADAGDRDAYRALRTLRTAVAQDLATRGTNLPALVAATTPQPEPSLVLAWRLYAEARRETGLVARAGSVIHPLFMPTQFEVLTT